MRHLENVKLDVRTQEASQADLRRVDFSGGAHLPLWDQRHVCREPGQPSLSLPRHYQCLEWSRCWETEDLKVKDSKMGTKERRSHCPLPHSLADTSSPAITCPPSHLLLVIYCLSTMAPKVSSRAGNVENKRELDCFLTLSVSLVGVYTVDWCTGCCR